MKLSTEINVVIVLTILAMGTLCAAVSVFSMYKTSQNEMRHIELMLKSERRTQLKDLVANAYSVLETANFYEPTQRAINNMRFGEKKANYFFVFDIDGLIWVYPNQPDMVGKIHMKLTDADGKTYIKEIIETARRNGQGFIKYRENQQGGSLVTKLAHFRYFEKWRWILGTAIAIDDIEQMLTEKKAEIDADLRTHVISILLITVLFMLISILAGSFLIRKRIIAPILSITQAAERIGVGDFNTKLNINSSNEINQLDRAVIRMQSSLFYAIGRLRKKNDGVECFDPLHNPDVSMKKASKQ
jgi:methyl-accepting chemotaxis protein